MSTSSPTTAIPSRASSSALAAFYRIGAIVVALILIVLIAIASGETPLGIAAALWNGAFGTFDQIGRVGNTLTVLLLCATGLIYTFSAGLYNLGIEGQLTLGAIAATLGLRLLGETLPGPLAIAGAILFGIAGGMLWGLLAGVLNVFGKISEIFAGLGLNFVAQGLAIFLIFGPWKRPGVASSSGTEPFNDTLWLGTFGRTEATPVGLALAILAIVLTIIILRGTYFGLKLRAVGQNLRASYILGIPATRQLLSAFAICGALAGLAGALQVVGNFHRLTPTISGNLGFLGLLVVMLVNFDPRWVLPVTFFFSALNVGSLQMPLVLERVDSSISGVIQGMLVLFALIGRGLAERRKR